MTLDPEIEAKAMQVRQAAAGLEVRESLASSVEFMDNKINTYEEQLSSDNDQFKDDIGTRQTNLENTFTQEIANQTVANPSNTETVAARIDNINNKTYDTLGKRLDDHSSQLADITKDRRYEKVIEKMINGESVIIDCYGDSVTAGWNDFEGNEPHPYPQTLQALLREYYNNQNIIVNNRGYSGYQSTQLATDSFINNVINDNPDLVILMVGINDCIGNNNGAIVPISDYKNNLLIIKNKLGNIPLMMMTPTPIWGGYQASINDNINNINAKDRFYQYVEAVKSFSEKNDLKIVDLNAIILEDIMYQDVRPEDISPDLIHYTDAYYQTIAGFVFAFGLCNINIIVKKDEFIPSFHDIFKFINNVPQYNKSNVNPEKINISQSASNTNHIFYAWVFIKTKTLDLILNNILNQNGSSTNLITIDGVDYTLSNYVNNPSTYWNVMTYIKTLPYGLHKIKFTAVQDANGKSGLHINGLTFKETEISNIYEGLSANFLSYNTNYMEMIYKGYSNISLITNSSSPSFASKKIFKLGYLNNKHYRIYADISRCSGIAIGTAYVRDTSGNVHSYAPLYIHNPGLTYKVQLFYQDQCNDSALQTPALSLMKTTTIDGWSNTQTVIIDIYKNSDKVDIYMNGTLLYSLLNTEFQIGTLDIYTMVYNDGPNNTTGDTVMSAIQKIEEIDYDSIPTLFNIGETYFDYATKSKKIYDGTTFKTITMS